MRPSEILEDIKLQQALTNQSLEQILSQTTGLHSRVSDLEKWKEKLGGIWFAILMTCGGIGFVTTAMIGILQIIKHL
jgi:hypothetical protein